MDTCSPSISVASKVISSGVSMMMAVNSPTGITCRLRKASALMLSKANPRSACRPGLPVCSSARPRRGQLPSSVEVIWNR